MRLDRQRTAGAGHPAPRSTSGALLRRALSSRRSLKLPAALPALLLALLLGPFAAAPASAESSTTVELRLYDAVARMGTGSWVHSGGGEASLSLEQRGNRSVRSSFELSMLLVPSAAGSPDAIPDVSRAYAKFRHEQLVGIIGKAPFSWGEGTIFNAAQAIFGSGLSTQLAQSEFEEHAAWLTGVTWYTGPFSFVELLVLPPPLSVSYEPPTAAPAGLWESRVGGRWVAKPLGIKTELGYLLDGRSATPATGAFAAADYYHRPYLSLQGNLWLDWHLSASLEIPEEELSAAALQQGSLFTAGLYSVLPVGRDNTFNFRLEARLRPWAEWSQDHSGSGDYGLFAYGELGWDFGGGFSLLLRSQLSPVDRSARLTPGLSWNLFQGFTLFGFATFQAGEAQDHYAWRPAAAGSSGLSLLAGCSVIY